jgi:hypothetical protein
LGYFKAGCFASPGTDVTVAAGAVSAAVAGAAFKHNSAASVMLWTSCCFLVNQLLRRVPIWDCCRGLFRDGMLAIFSLNSDQVLGSVHG